MKEICRFTIDLVPPSLNTFYSTNVHWTKRQKLKATYRTYMLSLQNDIPKIKKFPIAIEATVYRKDKRKRDSDNAIMSIKLVADSLVAMKKIPDDHSEYVKWVKCAIENNAQRDYTEFIIYELEEEQFKLN